MALQRSRWDMILQILTPLKFNMESEKKSPRKGSSSWKPSFSGSMLNFGGVCLFWYLGFLCLTIHGFRGFVGGADSMQFSSCGYLKIGAAPEVRPLRCLFALHISSFYISIFHLSIFEWFWMYLISELEIGWWSMMVHVHVWLSWISVPDMQTRVFKPAGEYTE